MRARVSACSSRGAGREASDPPMAAFKRSAALPVGAPRRMFWMPEATSAARIRARVWVFPVPGPPVMMASLRVSAARAARTWGSPEAAPGKRSCAGCGSGGVSSGAAAMASRRAAMAVSARWSHRDWMWVCPFSSKRTSGDFPSGPEAAMPQPATGFSSWQAVPPRSSSRSRASTAGTASRGMPQQSINHSMRGSEVMARTSLRGG